MLVLGAAQIVARRRRVEPGGVDADPDAAHGRIGQLRGLDIAFDTELQVGQFVMRQPAHMLAGRLVAHDQRVGLRAVDQAERDPGIGGVKQRALALDQVPVVGVVGRAEPLDRAGHEIGDDRVDRHAVAGDKDAGLAGGAEIGLDAARPHLLFERQRREHFSDRAVGADRQQALAGTLDAGADREIAGRVAHVVDFASEPRGGIAQGRDVGEAVMQPTGQIHAEFHRVQQ